MKFFLHLTCLAQISYCDTHWKSPFSSNPTGSSKINQKHLKSQCPPRFNLTCTPIISKWFIFFYTMNILSPVKLKLSNLPSRLTLVIDIGYKDENIIFSIKATKPHKSQCIWMSIGSWLFENNHYDQKHILKLDCFWPLNEETWENEVAESF